MLSVRLVLHCLLLIIFCQHVEVKVDQLQSSDSPLPVEDNTLTEVSKSQIHLTRQKRNVNQQTTYEIDIELNRLENGFSLDTLKMILDNVTYPLSTYFQNGSNISITRITPTTVNQQTAYEIDIELNRLENGFSLDSLKLIRDNVTYPFSIYIQSGSNISITRITPTTVCQLVNNEIQCTCITEFTWNSTLCKMRQSCGANTTADQTCKCIRGYPIEGEFCDVIPTQNATQTTVTTTSTSTTMSSSSTSTSTSTSSSRAMSSSTGTSSSSTSTSTSTSSSKGTSSSTSTNMSSSRAMSSLSTSTSTSTSSSTGMSTSKTTSTSATSPQGESRTFALIIKNLNFCNELKNASSAEYKNRSTEFTSLLNESYRKVVSDAFVKVLGFSSGSIIVLHQVFSRCPLTDEEVASSRKAVEDTLLEVNYSTQFLPEDEIPCTDNVFGTTSFNSIAEIPCMRMEGVRKRRCGKNGKYEDEHDFCLLYAISQLLKVTNSTAEVAKNFSKLLHNLSMVSAEQDITKPGNVKAAVTILTTFSEVNNTVTETDMENFLQTVSYIISDESVEAWSILSSPTAETSISSQLLRSVETFSSHLNLTNDTLVIKKDNLQLKATKIDSCKTKGAMNVTFDNFLTEGYTNLSANILIPTDELKKLVNNVVVTIAYPTWIDILPSKANFKGNFSINGPVVTITLSDKKPFKTKMNFSTRNPTLDFNSVQCAFWDFTGNGIWNNAGCIPDLDGENVICNCEHITSFSILMSAKTAKSPTLSSITQIGVAVSLASLIITIIIEAVVWRHVTKSEASHIRHVAILNIAINLLIADVWFIVAASVKQDTGACVAATFFIHVFYLALFFWMFTLGLLLVYHLVFLFHNFSKSVLMGISFGIGYLCPILISVITIGVTYPQNSYIRKDACWLSWREKYPILAYIIPALSIIASNFIVLVVVIFKLLRPTVGDRPRRHNEEKDTIKPIVRSIAVLTPVLGLTWAFGIPIFQENSHDAFHYIFSILNAFQGFFIFIFVTCVDKKVREALLEKFSLTGISSRSRFEHNASLGRFASKHGIAFPGSGSDSPYVSPTAISGEHLSTKSYE
ncbi:adhesion G-protein coupled receptor F1-like isoform X2 [Mobula birostris]